MRIFITGGNGYLGARLSQFFALNGFEVHILTKKKILYKSTWAELISNILIGDLRDEEIFKKLTNCNFDYIIHLASLDRYSSERDYLNALDVNVKPLWRLLEIFSKKKTKKFIYFSTIHVLGLNINQRGKSIFEPIPVDNYGLTHLLGEKLCIYYANRYNINCNVIRLANSYGEPIFKDARCWNLLINNLVLDAFEKNKIIINGSGNEKRSFVHFSDICENLLYLINREVKTRNIIINYKSKNYFKTIDIARVVKKVFEKRYNKSIRIYVNKNQHYKFTNNTNKDMDKKFFSEENGANFKVKKNIINGIEDLFSYLDSE